MSNKDGTAGRSTRDMAARRHRNAILYACIGVLLTLIIVCMISNPNAFGLGGIGILLLLGALKILPDVLDGFLSKEIKKEKQAERGAAGEEIISDVLSELDDTYITLHDIESPYGNIDHIVISKDKGIFVIETKSHRGRVEIVDGQLLINGYPPEKDFIGQVLSNLYWLREKVKEITGIEVWIHPLLVFTNAFVVPGKPVRGVRLVNQKYLLSAISQTNGRVIEANKVWSLSERIMDRLPFSSVNSEAYRNLELSGLTEQKANKSSNTTMNFLSAFLRNLLLLVGAGILLLILFPTIMGSVFGVYGAIFGPLAIIMLLVFALPQSKSRKRRHY